MNIRTIQQVNDLDCCPCPFPECTPRQECQSISLGVCGYSLPNHDDLETGEDCLRFATRVDVYHNEFNVTMAGGYSQDQVIINDQSETREKWTNEAGECVTRFVSGTWSNFETLFQTSGGSTVLDTSYSGTGSAGSDEVWSGTYTFTDSLDAANNDSGAVLGITSAGPHSPDNTWVYTSPGIYSRTYTVSNVDYTDTATFSDPITAVSMEESIDAVIAEIEEGDPWPDESCSSVCVGESDDCSPTSITKSRIRFGPPVAHTGTTWEMEWDFVTASAAWWAWYDDGMVGTEPTPGPSLVSHETWTWDGVSEWSDWYEIPVPNIPGETRAVNVLTICWRSTRIGVKPTSYGDEVALP